MPDFDKLDIALREYERRLEAAKECVAQADAKLREFEQSFDLFIDSIARPALQEVSSRLDEHGYSAYVGSMAEGASANGVALSVFLKGSSSKPMTTFDVVSTPGANGVRFTGDVMRQSGTAERECVWSGALPEATRDLVVRHATDCVAAAFAALT